MQSLNWNDMPLNGPILRPRHAAIYLGISLSKYYILLKEDSFPPLIKISGRASGTPKPWLDAWLSSRINEIQE